MTSLHDAGLATFPFRIVPPFGPTDVWVGRSELKQELLALTASWPIRSDSGLYLLWAALGSGKTHSLRFLEHLGSKVIPPTLAVYAEMPEASKDFKDVYEQLIQAIPEAPLQEAIRSFRSRHGDKWLDSPILNGDRYTPRVLWILAQLGDSAPGEVARKWLRGERMSTRELQALDNVPSLKDSDDATRTLTTICRILVDEGQFSRVVLMLDEFQRMGESNLARIRKVNAGIRKLFNSCPEHLAIVLSYSFGVAANIQFMMTDELRTIVGKTYHLPALSESDARSFVSEVISSSSLTGVNGTFQESAIAAVVARLHVDAQAATPPKNLTPRNLMQAFATVLEKALTSNESSFPIDEKTASDLYEKPSSL